MPIATGDILYKLSVTTGAAGNSTAGSVAGSLGRYVSTTQLVDPAINDMFDGDVDHKCFFVHNSHTTLALRNAVVWLSALMDDSGASVAIAVDNIGPVDVNQVSVQAAQTASAEIAPAGVSEYSGAAISKVTGLPLGDIGPGQVRAVWVRRIAAGGVPVSGDGVSIRVEGDNSTT